MSFRQVMPTRSSNEGRNLNPAQCSEIRFDLVTPLEPLTRTTQASMPLPFTRF